MMMFSFFFFFKQKTAYEMRISDWSSDVCSSDLQGPVKFLQHVGDTFITLMTAANIGLAHAMRPILPGIAACGQNHQREQSGRRQAERLAFHEFDLNDAAGLGKLQLGRASCRVSLCQYV